MTTCKKQLNISQKVPWDDREQNLTLFCQLEKGHSGEHQSDGEGWLEKYSLNVLGAMGNPFKEHEQHYNFRVRWREHGKYFEKSTDFSVV